MRWASLAAVLTIGCGGATTPTTEPNRGAESAPAVGVKPTQLATPQPPAKNLKELEDATAEMLAVNNRSSAVGDEVLFWSGKNLFAGVPPLLQKERDDLSKRADEMERALDKKYGYDRPKLTQLSVKRKELFEVLKDATHEAVKARLAAAFKSASEEIELTPGKPKGDILQAWAIKAHAEILADIARAEIAFLKSGK